MKLCISIAAMALTASTASLAQTSIPALPALPSAQVLDNIRAVSPALERYTQVALLGDLWKRPGLSSRDRSIVTLAILIARDQTAELPYYVNVALDSGVKPGEISEIVTHLAFYSGWGNAMAAIPSIKDVFAQRGISADQLQSAEPKLLAVDEASETKRAASVRDSVGPVSPGLVQFTGELLFHDLWLRPDLAPRDRSLVTISALIL
jgi:4-carboxymuconolactone decarboxylase